MVRDDLDKLLHLLSEIERNGGGTTPHLRAIRQLRQTLDRYAE